MSLTKSRCPECAKKGLDTHHDNLITYSDGHSHCYACGYHTQARTRERIMEQHNQILPQTIVLPEDFTFDIPLVPLAWATQYISLKQLKENNVGYSPQKELLIFPYFLPNKNLMGWQGRYFGNNKDYPKWFSQGTLHETLHILGDTANSLVLVEDILSAIKVKDIYPALPLFGCFISIRLLTRLHNLRYNKLYIWLDPDKRKEAIKFSRQAKMLGFDVKPIFSDEDPKSYSIEEIKHMLD